MGVEAVILIIYILCVSFFIGGAFGLIYSEGKTSIIIMAFLLMGVCAFIAYGLDTRCNDVEYLYCG